MYKITITFSFAEWLNIASRLRHLADTNGRPEQRRTADMVEHWIDCLVVEGPPSADDNQSIIVTVPTAMAVWEAVQLVEAA